MKEFFETASELDAKAVPFVVVTFVSSRGHAPQNPGAKAIFTDKGLHFGTIGGGKLEARAQKDAMQMLKDLDRNKNTHVNTLEPRLVTWNLQTDVSMSCGGEVTLLFEVHHRKVWEIVIFGAGHVSQALVRGLLPIRCHVHCLDTRPEWLDRLPATSMVTRHHVEVLAEKVREFNENCYFVVMTQGHGTDLPVLQAIMHLFPKAPYIGVLGSEIKAKKIRNDLREFGIASELVDRLYCPMGLTLGNNDPAEITVSILAQLLVIRDRQNAPEKTAES